MKKIFSLLLITAAIFTLGSCLNEEISDVTVTCSVGAGYSFVGNPNDDPDPLGVKGAATVRKAYQAALDKAGFEKMSENYYVLRSQSSNSKAKSMALKAAKEAESALSSFTPVQYFTSLSASISVSSSFGDETVYEKQFVKE